MKYVSVKQSTSQPRDTTRGEQGEELSRSRKWSFLSTLLWIHVSHLLIYTIIFSFYVMNTFILLFIVDWVMEVSVGTKMWCNHKTGEVSDICPWEDLNEGLSSLGDDIADDESLIDLGHWVCRE